MLELFDTLVYHPIYNVLVFFYNTVPGHDFGIAIILTTLLVKTLFIPLSKKQIESQKKMQELQPKLKELQKRYKDDKEKQTKAIMELYREHKANPFSGCLPLIVQLIVLIAIYRVIINISQAGFTINAADLYTFIANPGSVKHLFLNFVDLTKPNYVLGILSAIAQYYQTKMLMQSQKVTVSTTSASDEPDFATIMNKQMLYIGPAITLFIGVTFPAALALYWLFSTLFMIFQQRSLAKKGKETQAL
ncbi:MAG: YidC/Oxa1 family membrane protein insertase [Candidatus Moranbacteria bacterium]|nr:YidC/Oxa1 family membrane protein insertase [Candidatus Moranbacteria bacterium]